MYKEKHKVFVALDDVLTRNQLMKQVYYYMRTNVLWLVSVSLMNIPMSCL